MTFDGWRAAVVDAVSRHEAGDSTQLDLLAALLTAQDAAKARLESIGLAWTGLPWPKVIEEIEAALAKDAKG